MAESDPAEAPESRAAPSGPLVRVRAVIAYDGTGFHGVAANANVRTVIGELNTIIERAARCEGLDIVCAGRTDAGVHARTQMLSFDLPESADLQRIQRSVNSILGPEVVMRSLTVAPGFHARFDAQWRHYRYLVLNRPVNDPFLARTAWHVTDPLRLGWMRLGCDPLIGEHDFAAFCRPGVGPTTRRVVSADWFDDGDGVLRFEIRANAFCQQMVRSIVGLLVEVGRGRRRAGDVTGVLQAKDRSHFGTVAPPNGLTLWDVGY